MPPRHRLVRVVLCLAMLLLTIQLFCMAFHRHALNERVTDCVSCYSASQIAGGVEEPVLAVASSTALQYQQPLLIAIVQRVLFDFLLTPPSHGPPALS